MKFGELVPIMPEEKMVELMEALSEYLNEAYGAGYNDGLHAAVKQEPDPWEGAPDWARYKAMDSDGQTHWFECKPERIGGNWSFPDGKSLHMRIDPVLIERPQQTQEKWQPRAGEVCLFWTIGNSTKLAVFDYGNGGFYYTVGGTGWDHVAKAYGLDDLKLSIEEIKARGEWL